jgi:hypothetical protein
MCGRCTFCKTGAGISFQNPAQAKPDPRKLQAILNACPERDDPRLLARMAFGITSPRLTAGKWSTSHPLFGSMVDTDFGELVNAFDAECKELGYIRAASPASPTKKKVATTTNKRAYSQMSLTSRSTSGPGSTYDYAGRGRGNYKRGRRG